jgi:hypothetical protein
MRPDFPGGNPRRDVHESPIVVIDEPGFPGLWRHNGPHRSRVRSLDFGIGTRDARTIDSFRIIAASFHRFCVLGAPRLGSFA